MLELVDKAVLEAVAERRESSSLSLGTRIIKKTIDINNYFLYIMNVRLRDS